MNVYQKESILHYRATFQEVDQIEVIIMANEQIRIGRAQAYRNVSGTRILRYTVEIYHKGLNEHKLISAPERNMLDNKVNLQICKWNEKWEIIESKRKVLETKESNIEEASNRTKEAEEALSQIDKLLMHTLSINDTVDWESLKKNEEFQISYPPKPEKCEKSKCPLYVVRAYWSSCSVEEAIA